MGDDIFLYKMPIKSVLGGSSALVEIPFQNDFAYIRASYIVQITVSDENLNWSRVVTNIVGPPPIFGYLIFIVPIQVDDLVKDIYSNYKEVNQRYFK